MIYVQQRSEHHQNETWKTRHSEEKNSEVLHCDGPEHTVPINAKLSDSVDVSDCLYPCAATGDRKLMLSLKYPAWVYECIIGYISNRPNIENTCCF